MALLAGAIGCQKEAKQSEVLPQPAGGPCDYESFEAMCTLDNIDASDPQANDQVVVRVAYKWTDEQPDQLYERIATVEWTVPQEHKAAAINHAQAQSSVPCTGRVSRAACPPDGPFINKGALSDPPQTPAQDEAAQPAQQIAEADVPPLQLAESRCASDAECQILTLSDHCCSTCVPRSMTKANAAKLIAHCSGFDVACPPRRCPEHPPVTAVCREGVCAREAAPRELSPNVQRIAD